VQMVFLWLCNDLLLQLYKGEYVMLRNKPIE
jgi:hypothetical protein